ncbi:MAG: hypothetical protein R6U44_10180 [Archaeoglobaceae archaeon]
MNRKLYIILGALAILIGVDIALILYTPTPTGPPSTIPQLHPLEEVNGIGVGDIVVVNRNGVWELSSVQYPGGVLKGEELNESYNYHPNITIHRDSNTISFDMGILVEHLNQSAKKNRELKIVEWTYSGRVVLDESEVRKSAQLNLSPGLNNIRYTTTIPESDNCTTNKVIELKIQVLAEKEKEGEDGEIDYVYDQTNVGTIEGHKCNLTKKN